MDCNSRQTFCKIKYPETLTCTIICKEDLANGVYSVAKIQDFGSKGRATEKKKRVTILVLKKQKGYLIKRVVGNPILEI